MKGTDANCLRECTSAHPQAGGIIVGYCIVHWPSGGEKEGVGKIEINQNYKSVNISNQLW